MYFYRTPHPSNFVFAHVADPATGALELGQHRLRLELSHLGADVYRLRLAGGPWGPHGSHAELADAIEGSAAHEVRLSSTAGLEVVGRSDGEVVLRGRAAGTFGVCGQTWMLQFEHKPDMQFYGLGEHCRGLEKSGQRVKFWNTDLFGDFAHCEIYDGYPNPMYVAIPWVIVKRGNRYAGLLVNNPDAVFMELASNFVWSEQNPEDRERGTFYLGAPGGEPEVYVVVGPDLPALLQKLQTLVGRTPRPPLWALGHHQCRWGYGGPEDLERLDRQFREHEIPCDGLWLDIDYMDRYKVFTLNPELWRDAEQVREVLARLREQGRRVVPIIDPGVKAEADYAVADEGLRERHFCLNPEGRPYVGFVWPGRTYLPDFSREETRRWWAEQVEEFIKLGFSGAWIDMNDPSVGVVELDDMRFDEGRQPHAYYHNQYGLGMAQATRAGLLAASPGQRPFLLSRSAFISSSRHAALWLGDNVSNWHHLRMAIPLSLGLAMSGLPFNGPDVGGFMRDTTPELAVAWYKAGFLFPFLRNHSNRDTRDQEPWALGEKARQVIGHYVRLRYKLLPYLYQLFIRHERTGEAIQRPLFHDFVDTETQPLGRIEDQFLVGPDIMQAPLLVEGQTERSVILPAGVNWFDGRTGEWEPGGRTVDVRTEAAETPLYVREGALIPMQVGERTDNRNDLATIELHCVVKRSNRGCYRLLYVCDDGETVSYQRGEQTTVEFIVTVQPGELQVEARVLEAKFRPIVVSVVTYDRFERVAILVGGVKQVMPLRPHSWRLAGRSLATNITDVVLIGGQPAVVSAGRTEAACEPSGMPGADRV